MLQLWKTLGKNIRLFQENKQTRHKSVCVWGGRQYPTNHKAGGAGLFSKIPELMHNVLSNEKDAIEVRHNYHFCYILRDLFKYCAINEF